jgi:hypothetical protein
MRRESRELHEKLNRSIPSKNHIMSQELEYECGDKYSFMARVCVCLYL